MHTVRSRGPPYILKPLFDLTVERITARRTVSKAKASERARAEPERRKGNRNNTTERPEMTQKMHHSRACIRRGVKGGGFGQWSLSLWNRQYQGTYDLNISRKRDGHCVSWHEHCVFERGGAERVRAPTLQYAEVSKRVRRHGLENRKRDCREKGACEERG